ncbi:MAG TPA: polysaccharide pyruvyl transferase family protein [Pseudomonas xinjiangensis]|uniref:Polysaccharide pyruvyl transferase family protein n=2 Tax=root TaxID=1 RepID=A0A7V1FSN0_9GAMM|nr:polysaccharide pyruvyl transferase family protein [Halopseudomonas xinjiangensis]HEC48370.1 polysaccharide pyruvyl transferase family protein [Halopseudomonas xinjiangensis]
MNIGILTFQRAHNYGAQFQAYALQTFLGDHQHNAEFIDYWPAYRKGMYDMLDLSAMGSNLSPFQKLKKTTKSLLKLALTYPRKKTRHERFERFMAQHLNFSAAPTILAGKDIPRHYDAYVFGSDQIWRYNQFNKHLGYDSVYWGKYPADISARKVSYAASMGVLDQADTELDFISGKLEHFDALSVRENSLKDLLQPLTRKPISKVLDPAFLLDKTRWAALAAKNMALPEQYVLLYNLNKSSRATSLADDLANKLGCAVFELSSEVVPFDISRRYQNTAGPAEFLALFENATHVISTSFHGVVFSLIFEKQFQALGLGQNASRVTNLLTDLGIPERYSASGAATPAPGFHDLIDYKAVNELLSRLREDSVQFLMDNVVNGEKDPVEKPKSASVGLAETY